GGGGGAGRRGVGAADVRGSEARSTRRAVATGPVVDARGAAAAGGDPRAAASRVPPRAPRWLPLYGVLRRLPALAGSPRPGDAAVPQGGRQDLRRLLGEEAAHRRPHDWRAR